MALPRRHRPADQLHGQSLLGRAGWPPITRRICATAEADAYEQFRQLAPVAATRNVLLPVGGDHVIPSRWATAIHRDWNARYAWPRFVTAVPSEFFAAVRAEAAERDIWITPQTRDMNPVYTGKDVTYIDTKQAQRAAETAVLDGERLATLAWLAGADYPAASLDKAWRQLVFGAHHDAITGSEGDQVYLDLLGGWREAWERGDRARAAALSATWPSWPTPPAWLTRARPAPADRAIAGHRRGQLAVLRPHRDGLAPRLELPRGWPAWLSLRDDTGAAVPFLAEGAGQRRRRRARRGHHHVPRRHVPGVGYRSYLAAPADAAERRGRLAAGGRPAHRLRRSRTRSS